MESEEAYNYNATFTDDESEKEQESENYEKKTPQVASADNESTYFEVDARQNFQLVNVKEDELLTPQLVTDWLQHRPNKKELLKFFSRHLKLHGCEDKETQKLKLKEILKEIAKFENNLFVLKKEV
jgi:hypothetical protein